MPILGPLKLEYAMLSRSTTLIFATVALSGGLLVQAADQTPTQPSAPTPKSGQVLSIEEIQQRARAQYPGKILETELEHKLGRYVYEIDVVGDDGVKKELKYDAKSGELLSAKVENEDDDDD